MMKQEKHAADISGKYGSNGGLRPMKKWIAVVFVFSALLCAVSASADGLKAGDAVTFGRYGEAPVEWTVLETQGDKALLLSRYLLDMKWFNLVYDGASWEESSVRSWLNGEFLRAASNAEERAAILLTDVDNSDAQGCAECKDHDSRSRLYFDTR